MTRLILFSLLLIQSIGGFSAANNTIVTMEIKGAIGPAVVDYIQRGIHHAVKKEAQLIIITMDTPGGLVSSTRSINKEILASKIPIVTYVWPKGAHAASAGTYILYASHIAAMAPATNLGAATPVSMGGGDPGSPGPLSPSKKPTDKKEKQPSTKPDTAMGRKVLNDAVAYIESLAQLRNRNVEWARKSVIEGASLPALEAKKEGVVNIIADDLQDLIKQLHQMKVVVQKGGEPIELQTEGALIETWNADWRTKILTIITDPNIAYIFLLLAFYGIMLEFWNPGAIVPGVVGAISLIIALYSLQLLPISYAGLALILLGIAFMVAEALVPSFGILGFGGVIAFVVGSLFLFDSELETYQLSLSLVIAVAICNVGFFTMLFGMIYRNRNKPVVSGMEYMIGKNAEAKEDFDQEGRVWIQGESWLAISPIPIKKGQQVKVIAHDGLKLSVEPIEENS